MNWFSGDIPNIKNVILTIGNFDGVHIGHQRLITHLVELSKYNNLPSTVLTYIKHPQNYINSTNHVNILTPFNSKLDLLRKIGVNFIFVLNFSSKIAKITAEYFLHNVIVKNFKPKIIIVGYDSHFGNNREGTCDFLRANQDVFKYETIQIEPVYYDNEIVSSSLIKKKIQMGEIDKANAMLGRPYRLYGKIVNGKGLGTKIGFPTINTQLIDTEQLLPPNGVYFSTTEINGSRYFGLTNIGYSPTMKNNDMIEIETHLLGFGQKRDINELEIDLLKFIRPERKFNKPIDLQIAIKKDITYVEPLISEFIDKLGKYYV